MGKKKLGHFIKEDIQIVNKHKQPISIQKTDQY